MVDGHDRPGDEDLVVHFAMTRARGTALLGPDPMDLFPEPDRQSLMRGFLGDMEWAASTARRLGKVTICLSSPRWLTAY